jgi:hypothetical protein
MCVVDRLMGIFAAAARDYPTAETCFRNAVAFCEKAGYRPELAWSYSDYGEFLAARNGPGDIEQARDMQSRSLAVARELGMKPLIERIVGRKQILGA